MNDMTLPEFIARLIVGTDNLYTGNLNIRTTNGLLLANINIIDGVVKDKIPTRLLNRKVKEYMYIDYRSDIFSDIRVLLC